MASLYASPTFEAYARARAAWTTWAAEDGLLTAAERRERAAAERRLETTQCAWLKLRDRSQQ